MSFSEVEVRKWAIDMALSVTQGPDTIPLANKIAGFIRDGITGETAPNDTPPPPDVRLIDFTALQENLASGFTNLLNDHTVGGAPSELWTRMGIVEAQRMVTAVILNWASTHIRPVGG